MSWNYAADHFLAAAEQGLIKETDDEFMMANTLRLARRLQEAEKYFNLLDDKISLSPSVSLSRNIALGKASLHLAAGNYQLAWSVLANHIDNNSDKEKAVNWAYAYLDTVLGHEQVARSLVSDVSFTRPNVGTTPGQINLALMDYKSPDYHETSRNIGDYIQTVAVMRHIARHLPDNTFTDTGEDDSTADGWYIESEQLKSAFNSLRHTWDENERRDVKTRGKFVVTDRDSAWGATQSKIDQPIWFPVFGWFTTPPFGMVPVIPFPDQYKPIFFSFHLYRDGSTRRKINQAFIDYLKYFEPIGCRDYNTRDFLMSQGIDAFFTGCVTTTLVLDQQMATSGEILNVEAKLEKAGYTHIDNNYREVQFRCFDENITETIALLRRFQRAEYIVTSRLHCYLPARALGSNVQFMPLNQHDHRYDGLVGLNDNEFGDMGQTLTDLLDGVFGKIMSGVAPEDVYAYWRETTRPLVEKSKLEYCSYRSFFDKKNDPPKKVSHSN